MWLNMSTTSEPLYEKTTSPKDNNIRVYLKHTD